MKNPATSEVSPMAVMPAPLTIKPIELATLPAAFGSGASEGAVAYSRMDLRGLVRGCTSALPRVGLFLSMLLY